MSLLFPANMVFHRAELMAIGGFDEAFARAAEDGDLCLRWLRSGRTPRYEPALTVWHRDWRSRDEIAALHVRYAFDQGRMYGKHSGGASGRSRRSWLATSGRPRESCSAGCVGGRCPSATGATGSHGACRPASSLALRSKHGSRGTGGFS